MLNWVNSRADLEDNQEEKSEENNTRDDDPEENQKDDFTKGLLGRLNDWLARFHDRRRCRAAGFGALRTPKDVKERCRLNIVSFFCCSSSVLETVRLHDGMAAWQPQPSYTQFPKSLAAGSSPRWPSAPGPQIMT